MRTILTTLFLIPVLAFSQYSRSPQLGFYMSGGLRDYTAGAVKIKSRHGFDLGLNVKHSTRNGILRLVYAGGFISDYYRTETLHKDRIKETKIKGISILIRPEFRILNKERFALFIGVGPRFSSFISYKEKSVFLENGQTTVFPWKERPELKESYFGAHVSISADYKFAKHWALNLGINGFTGFEFAFYDGSIFSGGNITIGMAYVF